MGERSAQVQRAYGAPLASRPGPVSAAGHGVGGAAGAGRGEAGAPGMWAAREAGTGGRLPSAVATLRGRPGWGRARRDPAEAAEGLRRRRLPPAPGGACSRRPGLHGFETASPREVRSTTASGARRPLVRLPDDPDAPPSGQ